MSINFFDSEQVPKPRDQIRIENLKATPYPDRRRIYIEVKVTPFQERPNLIIAMHDDADTLVGEVSVIETMHANMEFTLHLRNVDDPTGAYSVTADLFYDTRNPPQDHKVEGFVIPEEDVT